MEEIKVLNSSDIKTFKMEILNKEKEINEFSFKIENGLNVAYKNNVFFKGEVLGYTKTKKEYKKDILGYLLKSINHYKRELINHFDTIDLLNKHFIYNDLSLLSKGKLIKYINDNLTKKEYISYNNKEFYCIWDFINYIKINNKRPILKPIFYKSFKYNWVLNMDSLNNNWVKKWKLK